MAGSGFIFANDDDVISFGDITSIKWAPAAAQAEEAIAKAFQWKTWTFDDSELEPQVNLEPYTATVTAPISVEEWNEFLSKLNNSKTRRTEITCSDLQAGQIIRQAAKTIEKYGWIQGAAGSHAHGFCILGAINIQQSMLGNVAAQMFFDWLKGIIGDEYAHIPHWNDHRDRTKEEVLKYMFKFADEFDPRPALTEE